LQAAIVGMKCDGYMSTKTESFGEALRLQTGAGCARIESRKKQTCSIRAGSQNVKKGAGLRSGGRATVTPLRYSQFPRAH
jgi:hypothetical protein